MSKISELSDGGSLVSSDYLIAVRSGGNVKVRMDQINVDQIDLGDNEFIRLGNSQDLTIVHNASNSIINQAGIGDLLIQKAGTTKASFTTNGLEFPDNSKAIFGAGSDLQIYHDGNHSYIEDAGTGSIKIKVGDFRVENASGNNLIKGVGDVATLHHAGSEKLATTSTGLDVTGTVTATAALEVSSGVPYIDWTDTATTDEDTRAITYNGDFYIGTINDAKTTTKKRFLIDHSTGDISFYEDTGTTAKLFWDASAESLGIGTASPSAKLTLNDSGQQVGIDFKEAGTTRAHIEYDGTIPALELGTNGAANVVLKTSNTERMRIDSSGNASIGTGSNFGKLRVEDTGWSSGSPYGTVAYILGGDVNDANWGHLLISQSGTATGSGGKLSFGSNGDNPIAGIKAYYAGATYGHLDFYTRPSGGTATQRMRIDSSGNFFLSKSSSNGGTAGHELLDYGRALHTVNATTVQILNRLSNDGTILLFEKDGSNVGSIGVINDSLYIASPYSTDAGLRFSASIVHPCTTTGAPRDDAIDLGYASARFDDIYATNGTIQTSDRNEKQDIEALSDAEQRVAVAAKGLLRKFRWKSSVAEKADEARTHFGIIAQDLQAAFEAEGLDAGDYAMFINSTWTDEETGEERSRMGVRYSELLAFIIAAI